MGEHEAKLISPLDVTVAKAKKSLVPTLTSPEETFLREHQMSLVQDVFTALNAGSAEGYISVPTGYGKAVVMVYLAHITGLKTVMLSPTQQILTQTHEAADNFAPELDITDYFAKKKDLSGQVVNMTYQSADALLAKASDKRGDFKPEYVELLLCDEADLGLGEKRHRLYRQFPNAIMIGLTATPAFDALDRLMQRGVVKEDERWVGMFRNLMHEMTLEEGMERGILPQLDVHMIQTDTVVDDITILTTGEYRQSDVERYFATTARNALAIGG